MSDSERYLAGAVDHADLERRMKTWDAGHPSRWDTR